MTIVALLDYAWQRHRWFFKQKMSLKEIRDELKETDGDPAVKARIRQIRLASGRSMMLSKF